MVARMPSWGNRATARPLTDARERGPEAWAEGTDWIAHSSIEAATRLSLFEAAPRLGEIVATGGPRDLGHAIPAHAIVRCAGC